MAQVYRSDNIMEEKRHLSPAKSKGVDWMALLYNGCSKIHYILLAALIGALLFGLMAWKTKPLYTATAKIYVATQQEEPLNITSLQMGSLLMQDYKEALSAWEVHAAVKEKLKLPYTIKQMQALPDISYPADSRVLYITIGGNDPEETRDIANAYAEAGRDFIARKMKGAEAELFSEAQLPAAPALGSHILQTLIGFMVGALAAMGLLTVRFILDDAPKTPEDVHAAGLSALAVLPEKENAAYGKAVRHLAAQVAVLGEGKKTLLLTSRYEEEDLSVIGKALADALAVRNEKVLLVMSSGICEGAEALEMARHTDGALIIAEAGRGSEKDLCMAAEELARACCPAMGVVLTGVDFDTFMNRRYYYRSEKFRAYRRK